MVAARLYEHRARVCRSSHGRRSRLRGRLAHVAAYGARATIILRDHFGAVAAGHAVVVQQHGLVVLAHDARERGDLLGLYAANGICPFGSLRRAVVDAQRCNLSGSRSP